MDEWAAALADWPALSGVRLQPVPGYPDVADLGAVGLLKRCREAEPLERELAVVGDLAKLGLPVAVPRRTARDAPWAQRPEGRYLWLPRLPGVHLTDLLDRKSARAGRAPGGPGNPAPPVGPWGHAR